MAKQENPKDNFDERKVQKDENILVVDGHFLCSFGW